jgi:hypothetical protein
LLVARIVRSYLLHYGYEDTLNAFDVASKSTVPPINIVQENGIDDQETTYALNHRKTLRQVLVFFTAFGYLSIIRIGNKGMVGGI